MAEETDILAKLEKSIRQRDWSAVAAQTATFEWPALPLTEEALSDYSRRLQKLLVATRVARAELSVSLGRVRAAARFNNARVMSVREEYGDPATF